MKQRSAQAAASIRAGTYMGVIRPHAACRLLVVKPPLFLRQHGNPACAAQFVVVFTVRRFNSGCCSASTGTCASASLRKGCYTIARSTGSACLTRGRSLTNVSSRCSATRHWRSHYHPRACLWAQPRRHPHSRHSRVVLRLLPSRPRWCPGPCHCRHPDSVILVRPASSLRAVRTRQACSSSLRWYE